MFKFDQLIISARLRHWEHDFLLKNNFYYKKRKHYPFFDSTLVFTKDVLCYLILLFYFVKLTDSLIILYRKKSIIFLL